MSPVTRADWETEYAAGTKDKGDKLVRKFTKKDGIVAAGTTKEAQDSYVAKMKDENVLAARQAKLALRTDAELKAAMKETGKEAYENKTQSKATISKAGAGVEDYLPEVERIKAGLPAKTGDPKKDVENRVTPFAVGLRKKKIEKLKLPKALAGAT